MYKYYTYLFIISVPIWYITIIVCYYIYSATLPNTYCCFGLSIDLLEKMSKDLEFDFHLYLVADGTFGSQKIHWNGVVGELVSGTAHMAFCPLSVTSTRLTSNTRNHQTIIIITCRVYFIFLF